MPYYSRHNSSKIIKKQINWSEKKKNELWMKIVKNKITNQALLLKKLHDDKYDLVLSYVDEVTIGDKTNREGHAAKVYFNCLFGKSFSRDDNNAINSALNYGYSVLLSTINKEVIVNGFLTQLGIHHKNEFNEFNLSCDLMEPFRVIIDNFVYYNQDREFNTNYKMDIINIFNTTFKYQNKTYTLKDILNMYVKNTLSIMDSDEEYKDFIYYEG